MNFKSNFLKKFYERGFYNNCTHPEELDEILANNKIKAYIGFDCTAKSLHVGSLMQIMILKMLQDDGHQPIILLGGGTTKIGDPSGKDEARKFLDPNQIQENLLGIKKTLEKFISFEGPNAAIIVNNDDWLSDLNYLEFLRDFGKYFTINKMLTFDSVKLRLDRQQPLTFLEFNYMILQSYDFYKLNKDQNCLLQIGGSDQWGNIVNGVELIRKKDNSLNLNQTNNETKLAFGLTSPLITTSDGKKMGKSANGAIWLDSNMLDPYDYFQYFRNVDDRDVAKFLRLFSELEIEEIKQLESLQDQEINKAKEILAFEVTKICHGLEAANNSLTKAREIFTAKNTAAFAEKTINLDENGEIKLAQIIKDIGAAESNSKAKKLIQGKAVKINSNPVQDPNHNFNQTQEFELAIGKKKFFKIIIK